ncbi:MAG: Nif11-like leader peptide family natural product precursor [Atopobiaceae bacterium]|nr:Nif11-like leader peptide family natural product precursor [Atopobiaceae bacterium]
MDLESLNSELLERIKECKTEDELKALADEAGFELTDELLAGIAGGDICIVDDSGGKIFDCISDKVNPWDCPQAMR